MLALPVSRYRLKERFEIFYHRNSALSMKDGLSFYMFLKNDFSLAIPHARRKDSHRKGLLLCAPDDILSI